MISSMRRFVHLPESEYVARLRSRTYLLLLVESKVYKYVLTRYETWVKVDMNIIVIEEMFLIRLGNFA